MPRRCRRPTGLTTRLERGRSALVAGDRLARAPALGADRGPSRQPDRDRPGAGDPLRPRPLRLLGQLARADGRIRRRPPPDRHRPARLRPLPRQRRRHFDARLRPPARPASDGARDRVGRGCRQLDGRADRRRAGRLPAGARRASRAGLPRRPFDVRQSGDQPGPSGRASARARPRPRRILGSRQLGHDHPPPQSCASWR